MRRRLFSLMVNLAVVVGWIVALLLLDERLAKRVFRPLIVRLRERCGKERFLHLHFHAAIDRLYRWCYRAY